MIAALDNDMSASELIRKWLAEYWEDKASGRTLDLNEDLTWIKNGNIISEKDTFSIYDLGSDTLTLENKDGIMFFSRSKK